MRARGREAREPIDTTAEVETPEHVRFRYRVAGPAQRAGAYLLDLVIRGLLLLVLTFLVAIGAAGSEGLGEVGVGVWLVVLFLAEWGYFVLSETLMGGRSIGKRTFNLRVVKEAGVPLTFVDSILRNLLRGADVLPMGYALGFGVMARDKSFRRLGDLVAGTLVVTEEKSRVRAPLAIHPPPSAEELSRIPARPALDAGDIEALELFVSRYGQLAPARELELAELVAPIYAKRMGLRYRNAARFLALLYFRATQPSAAQLAPQPAPQPAQAFGAPPGAHPGPPPAPQLPADWGQR